MRKFLSLTSLLLVVTMLVGVVGVFPASAETVNPWEAPEGIQTYYANKLTADPVIDGEIAEGEYGDLTVRMTPDMRLTFSGESTGQQDSVIDDDRWAQPASDYIDFYFAYDADYIYIAMEDMGGSWEEGSDTYEFIRNLIGEDVEVGNYAARNSYHFHTGFFLDDCTSFLSMQASSRGFDENKWFDQGTAMNANVDPIYGQPNAFCDAVYIKKTNLATGEVFADAPTGYLNESSAVRGNVNLIGAQYKAVIEIRYSKDKLLDLMNYLYCMDFVELPNAMWFWFTGRTYAANSTTAHGGDVTGYNRYFATDIRDDDTDYIDYGIAEGSSANTIPGLIVFGNENTELSLGRYEGDPEYPAAGLEYSSNWDGTCYVSGIGECDYVSNIVIPKYSPDGDLVVGIGSAAFLGCSNLESVTIPNSVTFIDNYAFAMSQNLKEVNFAEGGALERIAPYAFYHCDGLEEIEIPEGVLYIEDGAFQTCLGLKSLSIPKSVASLGAYMIGDCYYLDNISYAGNEKQWNNISKYYDWDCNAGLYTDDATYTLEMAEAVEGLDYWIDWQGDAYISGIGTWGNNANIVIPSVDPDGNPVVGIDYNAFYNCDNIVSVTIPESVKTIGEGAFSDCENLTTVIFEGESQLEIISGEAFKNCLELCNIKIPDGVSYIGGNAFYSCVGLESINIPESVTDIGESAFSSCYYLDNIYYAGTARKWNNISKYYGWDYRTGFYTSDFTYSIEFAGVPSFDFVTNNDGTCYISGIGDFENENYIVIPEYSPAGDLVTGINPYAFCNCNNIISITIPEKVRIIGEGAFDNCYNLTTVIFEGDSQLELIDDNAFNYCTSLYDIQIPDGVVKIGYRAFYYCASLERINIPESVTYIGESAFNSCYYLDNIYYAGTERQWFSIVKENGWDSGVGANTSDGVYTMVFNSTPEEWEPVTTESATTEPATTEPAPEEPWWTEEAPEDPWWTEEAPEDPWWTEPATTDEPAHEEPWWTEPATTESWWEPAPEEPWWTIEPSTTDEPEEDESNSSVTTQRGDDDDEDYEDEDDDDDDEDEEEETKKKKPAKTEAETEEEKSSSGGCGSSVSFAGLALVASLGGCAVFVVKKKED